VQAGAVDDHRHDRVVGREDRREHGRRHARHDVPLHPCVPRRKRCDAPQNERGHQGINPDDLDPPQQRRKWCGLEEGDQRGTKPQLGGRLRRSALSNARHLLVRSRAFLSPADGPIADHSCRNWDVAFWSIAVLCRPRNRRAAIGAELDVRRGPGRRHAGEDDCKRIRRLLKVKRKISARVELY
jgi:hypothetical protein